MQRTDRRRDEQPDPDAGRAAAAGLDGIAIKPAECDLRRLDPAALPVDVVTVDYEGREHLPDFDVLAAFADATELRLTTPVRADGFDPLGDDRLAADLPAGVRRVLVAGHGAYLSEAEAARAVAPRLGEAAAAAEDPWIGTEGVERLALATGAAQFALLAPGIERELRALRAAGFEAPVAVYAPTALTDDPDAILDAVGAYVARRGTVARALPDDAPVDRRAEGGAREVLLDAVDGYALTGSPAAVRERLARLRDAGADRIVGYPARGVEAFLP